MSILLTGFVCSCYLLEDKVELCLCLLHLVSLQQTQISPPEKMLGVVHDNLVSSRIEQGGLERVREEGGKELVDQILVEKLLEVSLSLGQVCTTKQH